MAASEWVHNVEKEGYLAGLKIELELATDPAHKKEIQEEIELVSKRTAVLPKLPELR